MGRKLASIRIVEDVAPVENSDNLDVITVLGWQVVTQRGEFKVGDEVVYCEIDSIMPEREVFDFLRPRHFRIKTIKLRGQISQGIAFPMTVLHGCRYPTDKRDNPTYTFKEGDDVTAPCLR
jgi:RNA ligase (TIGR02306 family)